MTFRTTQHGTVTVIHLSGNLMGGPDATTLNSRLHTLVGEGKKQVVLDFEGVEFMNSSGLGLLIGGAGLLKSAKGRLCLAGVSAKIMSLIKITKLGPIFQTYESVQDAVASFTK